MEGLGAEVPDGINEDLAVVVIHGCPRQE
jgi:hypothetical protein